jgi:hypothetical protein
MGLSANARQGTIITIDAPGAGTSAHEGTYATAISPTGDITGYYQDINSAVHSFVRSAFGRMTALGWRSRQRNDADRKTGVLRSMWWPPNSLAYSPAHDEEQGSPPLSQKYADIFIKCGANGRMRTHCPSSLLIVVTI